jgi:hypothetical protein
VTKTAFSQDLYDSNCPKAVKLWIVRRAVESPSYPDQICPISGAGGRSLAANFHPSLGVGFLSQVEAVESRRLGFKKSDMKNSKSVDPALVQGSEEYWTRHAERCEKNGAHLEAFHFRKMAWRAAAERTLTAFGLGSLEYGEPEIALADALTLMSADARARFQEIWELRQEQRLTLELSWLKTRKQRVG